MASSNEGILLTMGNPVLSITAAIGEDFLQKYGLSMNSFTLAKDTHKPMFMALDCTRQLLYPSLNRYALSPPGESRVSEFQIIRYEETASKYNVEYIPGGSTQNRIRVAQRLLRVPGATSFIGCIGKDKFGEEMKKSSKIDGVNAHYYEDENTPTGTCAVFVVGGERSVIGNLSAALCYKSEHLKRPENWALVEKAKYFYTSSSFLAASPDSMELVAEHAAKNNKVFMMDLSAPFNCEFFEDVKKALLYADLVFGNVTEARAFAEVHGWETENIEEIALKISQWPKASGAHKRIVVITQGTAPVCVAEDGKVKLFSVMKLPVENSVDTNGAGDAFVGGFLSRFVQEKLIEECVRAGCYAANEIIIYAQMREYSYRKRIICAPAMRQVLQPQSSFTGN